MGKRDYHAQFDSETFKKLKHASAELDTKIILILEDLVKLHIDEYVKNKKPTK